MSRKILALIIFVVAVAGAYGVFYAAVATVLMPNDLNNFKSELDSMPQLPLNNNANITEMENSAALMEKYSPFNGMSQGQRTSMANKMRNENRNIPSEILNQNFTEYNKFNNYRALAYALTLKGDLYDGINNLSSNYEEINILASEMVSLNQKMATDFENGDNEAYAEDLRDMASIMKQYNIKMALLKTQLQNVVNQLGG